MSWTKSKLASDSQQKKLRASCDGCYLTKIKCNKARPMCSRCLTYGIDCVYSPSSRSGRTKKRPDRIASKIDNDSGFSSSSQEQIHDDISSDPSSPFLYIPQINLSNSESQCDFNPTTLTADPGTLFDQYSFFQSENTVCRAGMTMSGNFTASFNSGIWWTGTGIPVTKPGSVFPENNNTLPLTSDFLFSSPHIFWNQYPDDLLDFTSYDSGGIPFSPSHSPTTSTSNSLPATCSCFAGYPQDLGVSHSDSCPSFQLGL